jgi:hypothetical protein
VSHHKNGGDLLTGAGNVVKATSSTGGPMTTIVSDNLRRLIPVALLAMTAVLGGSAVGDPAIACAVPQEWDIGAWDKCKKRVEDQWIAGQIPDSNLEDAYKDCCARTGGAWDAGKHACVAPPANPAAPRILPSGAPTQTLTPVPPPVVDNPGVVTQTLEPAPVG